jgi:putative two-component system response regulator
MWKNAIRQVRLLVVDDDPACVLELEGLLARQGFAHVTSTTDARQALSLFRRVRPDAVLLDLQMPHLDGFCVMEQLAQALPPRSHLPIMVLCPAEPEATNGTKFIDSSATGALGFASAGIPDVGLTSVGSTGTKVGVADWGSPQSQGGAARSRVCEGRSGVRVSGPQSLLLAQKRRALECGADDFILKPFDHDEIVLRLSNLLRMHLAHTKLQKQTAGLEESVRTRTRDLQEAEFEMLERLALAAEYRDDATGQHTYRVSRTAALLSHAAGLPSHQCDLIRRAAPLHDIGKIGIADGILLKKGALSDAERETMRTHTAIGAKILSGSRSALLQLAEDIALSHHEHWDGAGYPAGLQGDAIPLAGRIVSIADVFDALVKERPYKGAWGLEEAVEEILRNRGRQFDPVLVDAFASLPHDVLLHSDPSPALPHGLGLGLPATQVL